LIAIGFSSRRHQKSFNLVGARNVNVGRHAQMAFTTGRFVGQKVAKVGFTALHSAAAGDTQALLGPAVRLLFHFFSSVERAGALTFEGRVKPLFEPFSMVISIGLW
jgi:hypothetical protein